MALNDEDRAAAVWWYEGLSDDMKWEVLDAYRREGVGGGCEGEVEINGTGGIPAAAAAAAG